MPTPLETFFEEARHKARSATFSAEREKITAKRKAEKLQAKHGRAAPYSTLTMADIERLKKDGSYAQLAQDDAFVERVRVLEAELSDAEENAKEAEDIAVSRAALTVPPELEILERQETERHIFLNQAGVSTSDDLPEHAREEWNELIDGQQNELKRKTQR